MKYLSPVAATAQQSSYIIADARAPTRTPAGVVHFFMGVVKIARSIFTSRHRQSSKTKENLPGNERDSKVDNEKERKTRVSQRRSQSKRMSDQEQFHPSSLII